MTMRYEQRPAKMFVGRYSGNNQPTKKIEDCPFKPDVVMIYCQQAGAINASFHIKAKNNAPLFSHWIGITFPPQQGHDMDMIKSLDDNGFTVGIHPVIGNVLNIQGTRYTYICFQGIVQPF